MHALNTIHHTNPFPAKTVSELVKLWEERAPEQVKEYSKIFRKLLSANPPTSSTKGKHNFATSTALSSSYRPSSKSGNFKSVTATLCEVISKPFQEILRQQVAYREVQDIRRLLAIWIPVIAAHTFPKKGLRPEVLWKYWDTLDQDPTIGAGTSISISGQDKQIDELSKQKRGDEQFLEKLYNSIIYDPRLSAAGVGIGGKSIPDPLITVQAHELMIVIPTLPPYWFPF